MLIVTSHHIGALTSSLRRKSNRVGLRRRPLGEMMPPPFGDVAERKREVRRPMRAPPRRSRATGA